MIQTIYDKEGDVLEIRFSEDAVHESEYGAVQVSECPVLDGVRNHLFRHRVDPCGAFWPEDVASPHAPGSVCGHRFPCADGGEGGGALCDPGTAEAGIQRFPLSSRCCLHPLLHRMLPFVDS